MKLKKITLNNFRNYYGYVEFDLMKKVTILYGDNGNGKSSFFDALEWGITGEISRFSIIKNDYKSIVANNKMNDGDECSTSIHFDEYILKRSFILNTSGKFGNISVSLYYKDGRKLCSGEENVYKKLNELVSLDGNSHWDNKIMSKTYILSQDQIADFIVKDSPQERYNSLAAIMGFEKVNNLKNNILTASNVLNNKMHQIEKDINNINQKKTLLQNEYDVAIKKIDIDHEDLGTELDLKKKF